jgi:signal transduction histidine kinase
MTELYRLPPQQPAKTPQASAPEPASPEPNARERESARAHRSRRSRPVVLWAAIFAAFVLFDIALFGYLIFNSLSQRELEKVLLETREEAEPIAERLNRDALRASGRDLYTVISGASETKTYIESVLAERELLRSIEIRDQNGTVVYQQSTRDLLPVDGQTPAVDTVQPAQSVEVPIGDLGTMVVGLSDEEVERRIAVLRKDLTRQTGGIGILTVLLLVGAFGAFFLLHRRARRLEEQAASAERMAYIGTLASGLAHEIRSPLNSLSLNMQMLEEEARRPGAASLAPSSAQLRLLHITRSELKRLERLAGDFLSYARPQPLDRVPVKVSTLLFRLNEVLDGELRSRDVRAEVDDRSQGAVIDADPSQLMQLLLNLAQNGLAAIADRAESAARDTVAGNLLEPYRGVLRLGAFLDGGAVVLEVEDNGEGISPEARAKMFDLFYSNRKGGTGLGLAIVDRIAQAHDATIEVDSMPGHGATLRVRFPTGARSS